MAGYLPSRDVADASTKAAPPRQGSGSRQACFCEGGQGEGKCFKASDSEKKFRVHQWVASETVKELGITVETAQLWALGEGSDGASSGWLRPSQWNVAL